MLNPNSRQVYLDQIRPPEGYALDRAIATTFSLDLLSLLMAPLSMALHDCRNRENILRDPIAVLEALRLTTDRFAVFCQESRISVPNQNTRLYSLLEKVVVQVESPNENGVFHPKVWLLRFVADETDPQVVYRLLCLSKNLTFDRSWDTVLTLDGDLTNRRTGFKINRPLQQFFSRLPDLAKQKVSPKIREQVEFMADEVSKVRFEPPSDFDEVSEFYAMGIPGYQAAPEFGDFHRLLVMSPFVSDDVLTGLLQHGENNILISRPDSLDGLSSRTLAKVERNCSVYCLDEAAECPDDAQDEDLSADDDLSGSEFSGLHAKLFISEMGKWAYVYTGSANATNAAFGGMNTEFLACLGGLRRRVGIDAFLGGEDDKLSFRNMLQPYRRGKTPTSEEKVRKQLESDLDAARRAITRAELRLTVSPDVNETFLVTMTASDPTVKFPASVHGKCYPISLQEVDGCSLEALANSNAPLTFSHVSMTALTSFVAFRLSAESGKEKASIAFVLNLPIEGMPLDRDDKILHDIIADRGRFIRYLLFILAGDEVIIDPPPGPGPGNGNGNGRPGEALGIPLLEELVRAYSRHPEKIDRIARLVSDLKKSGQDHDLLPEGFEEVWSAFLAAREEDAKS